MRFPRVYAPLAGSVKLEVCSVVCVGFFRFTAARCRAGSCNVPTGITYIILLYIYSIETKKINKIHL